MNFADSVVDQSVYALAECTRWSVRNNVAIVSGVPTDVRDDDDQLILERHFFELLLLSVSSTLRLKDTERFEGRTV